MLVVDFSNKTIEADNHVIETYRTCEEKYRLMIRDHWVPAERASELAFGTSMHALRASYKKHVMEGTLPESAIEYAITKGLLVWNAEQSAVMKTDVMIDDKRSRYNLERLGRGYLAKFGDPTDYKPLHVEVPGKRFLGTTQNGWAFTYVYTIDEVVEHKGRAWPLEFKTSSGFYPPDAKFFSQFNNKAAVTGYIWACEQEFGYDIGGAIIHAMWVHAEPKASSKSKYTLPDYFKMDYTYRDDDQIEEWKRNTLLTGDDIVRSLELDRWKRADGLPCSVFNGCPMKRVCESTPGIRGKLLELDYEKREWNPWARLED